MATAEAMLAPPSPSFRLVRTTSVGRPVLVLGSSQRADDVVDAEVVADLGAVVTRRRTGGGAVWLDEHTIWIDVSVPIGDRLWSDDVGVAFHWLGFAIAGLCRARGIAASVHTGRLEPSRWGHLVCFAGVGAGEVVVEQRKLVGISQRRTRSGAVFQIGILNRWAPSTWSASVKVPAEDLAPAGIGLEEIGVQISAAEFVGAITEWSRLRPY